MLLYSPSPSFIFLATREFPSPLLKIRKLRFTAQYFPTHIWPLTWYCCQNLLSSHLFLFHPKLNYSSCSSPEWHHHVPQHPRQHSGTHPLICCDLDPAYLSGSRAFADFLGLTCIKYPWECQVISILYALAHFSFSFSNGLSSLSTSLKGLIQDHLPSLLNSFRQN